MTFCDKVHELLCQIKIDNNSKTRQLIDTILSLINSQSGSTFEIQKELSSKIYIAIQGYIKNDIKLGEGEMSEEQDNMLQAILPLIAYLNSPKNPWAHNGLFGNEITNAFHKDALAAYQSHESKETHYRYFSYHGYQYAYKPQTSPVEFNDEQIEILLDGKKTEKKNMGTAAKGFFGSLLTKGAAKDQKAIESSQSAQRRNILALPAPKEYTKVLMIEGPSATKEKGNAEKGTKSSSRFGYGSNQQQ